jgi:hypothetical protein
VREKTKIMKINLFSLLILAFIVIISTSCNNGNSKKQGGIVVSENEFGGIVVSEQDLGILNWYEAMNLSKSLSINGYYDWRIPTLQELDLVYKNLHKKGIGHFCEGDYWSSSEVDSIYAYGLGFSDGSSVGGIKKNKRHVRVVRTF